MVDVQKCIEGTRRKAAIRRDSLEERALLLTKVRELAAVGKREDARFLATLYCVRRGIA